MSLSQQQSEQNHAQELHQQHTSQIQQQFTQTNINSRGQLSRSLRGVWTDKNGGPGPAAWRTQRTGNIRGLARKKGVKAFWKTGFDVDDSVLSHPLFQPHSELPSASKKSKGPVSSRNDEYSSDTGLLGGKKKGLCSVM